MKSSQGSGDGWKIHIAVTPESPQLSDRITMQVSVEADRQLLLSDPQYLEFPETFKFRQGPARLPETKIADEHLGQRTDQVYHLEYDITPLTVGELPLPRIVIPFSIAGSEGKDVGIIAAPEISIRVTSEVKPSTVDLSELSLNPTPLETVSQWDAGYWTSVTLAGLCLVIAAIIYLRKHVANRFATKISSETLAEKRLDALEREKLPSQGKSEEYVTRLTDIVRNYIEAKTRLSVPERTTQEFISTIRQDGRISGPLKDKLKEFLETADLVKFAGQSASIEMADRSYDTAKSLVRSEHWRHFQEDGTKEFEPRQKRGEAG